MRPSFQIVMTLCVLGVLAQVIIFRFVIWTSNRPRNRAERLESALGTLLVIAPTLGVIGVVHPLISLLTITIPAETIFLLRGTPIKVFRSESQLWRGSEEARMISDLDSHSFAPRLIKIRMPNLMRGDVFIPFDAVFQINGTLDDFLAFHDLYGERDPESVIAEFVNEPVTFPISLRDLPRAEQLEIVRTRVLLTLNVRMISTGIELMGLELLRPEYPGSQGLPGPPELPDPPGPPNAPGDEQPHRQKPSGRGVIACSSFLPAVSSSAESSADFFHRTLLY